MMHSTVLHEVTEAELMREGVSFNLAHRKSMDAEIKAGIVPRKVIIEANRWFFKNRRIQ